MSRVLLIGLLLSAVSCAAPETRPALPPPLPDRVTALPYGQLLQRARQQATRATEAFYVNDWNAVEEAARGLEQTATYLVKAEDVPTKHKDTLATASTDLGKMAKALIASAKSKDQKKTNALMGEINAKVRDMRLGD
jgi:hypothetical protein